MTQDLSPTTLDQTPVTGWALIPPAVAASDVLTPLQKLVLGRIMGLVGQRGYCFASNSFLARGLGVRPGTITNVVSALVNAGLLRREQIKDDKQTVERRLWPIFAGGVPHVEGRVPSESEHDTGGVPSGSGVEGRSSKTRVEKSAHDILEYLNAATGRTGAERFASPVGITARLKAGVSLDDARLVIDHKVAEWGDNEEMCPFLRPQTLFGKEKFPGYLAAAHRWDKNGRPMPKRRSKVSIGQTTQGQGASQYAGLVQGGAS